MLDAPAPLDILCRCAAVPSAKPNGTPPSPRSIINTTAIDTVSSQLASIDTALDTVPTSPFRRRGDSFRTVSDLH